MGLKHLSDKIRQCNIRLFQTQKIAVSNCQAGLQANSGRMVGLCTHTLFLQYIWIYMMQWLASLSMNYLAWYLWLPVLQQKNACHHLESFTEHLPGVLLRKPLYSAGASLIEKVYPDSSVKPARNLHWPRSSGDWESPVAGDGKHWKKDLPQSADVENIKRHIQKR